MNMGASEDVTKKFIEFASYRGVIERTPISKIHSIDSDADGNPVYVVGRRHASLIVKALNDAGYEIVQREHRG